MKKDYWSCIRVNNQVGKKVRGLYNVDRKVKVDAFATKGNTTNVVFQKIRYNPQAHS